jgi:hypothetical protein
VHSSISSTVSLGIIDIEENLASPQRQLLFWPTEASMTKTLIIALGIASGLVSSALAPAAAGPIPTITAAVAQGAPSHAIDIYWRGFGGRGFGWRGGYGGGLAFGLAAGALAGAAIAGPYYGGRGYYYGPPMPLYSRPVYAAPYGYAPVYSGYYAPYDGYSYSSPSRCYTQEGYGRYRPCSAN